MVEDPRGSPIADVTSQQQVASVSKSIDTYIAILVLCVLPFIESYRSLDEQNEPETFEFRQCISFTVFQHLSCMFPPANG